MILVYIKGKRILRENSTYKSCNVWKSKIVNVGNVAFISYRINAGKQKLSKGPCRK